MYNEDYDPSEWKDLSREEQDMQDRLSLAQEFMDKLMRNLYGPHILNIEEMEDCLMELCDKLEVDFPHGGTLPIVKYERKRVFAGV